MASSKQPLLNRAAFSDLSLDGKNKYLQEVSRLIAAARGEAEPPLLDKEALSRLRRFYTRRRISDLALEQTKDPIIRASLSRMSEAIHLEEVRKVIAHETPTSVPVTTLREPPPDDAQLMFFVPTVHDAPLKDDMNLMDIAPFSLSKTVRQGVIQYELKDAIIRIEGGAEVGLVTAFDYDIFIHMVSHLAAQMREYRINERRGLRPTLPARTYRPSASQIFKFCRRSKGGRQYAQLESSLDRLQATRCKITNLTHNNTRRASESFPLIGRYKVVSRTKSGLVDEVEIEVPDWVYQGVVTPGETPSILTLNQDYFLISRPIARFIYRVARKATGASGFAEYGFDTLYQRSGSEMPFRKFRENLLEVVEASKLEPLPDFDLEVLPAKGGEKLRMIDRRKKSIEQKAA